MEAPRLFGPQKGALADDVLELEHRFALLDHARSLAKLPGGGAAGGLGAALASLGAQLVAGGHYVLEVVGFRDLAARADLVVTGEGSSRPHHLRGQGARARPCMCATTSACRCVLFGGRVEDGVEAVALSGDPARAAQDLEELGLRLGLGLA